MWIVIVDLALNRTLGSPSVNIECPIDNGTPQPSIASYISSLQFIDCIIIYRQTPTRLYWIVYIYRLAETQDNYTKQ